MEERKVFIFPTFFSRLEKDDGASGFVYKAKLTSFPNRPLNFRKSLLEKDNGSSGSVYKAKLTSFANEPLNFRKSLFGMNTLSFSFSAL
jgi:hypothetical protein